MTTATNYYPLDFTAGHTDQKELMNLLSVTFGGNVKGTFYYSNTAANVAEIDEGEQTTLTATVTGVALGDAVVFCSLGVDVVDAIVRADVTAANTVTVVIADLAASSFDLASTTLRIGVVDLT